MGTVGFRGLLQRAGRNSVPTQKAKLALSSPLSYETDKSAGRKRDCRARTRAPWVHKETRLILLPGSGRGTGEAPRKK